MSASVSEGTLDRAETTLRLSGSVVLALICLIYWGVPAAFEGPLRLDKSDSGEFCERFLQRFNRDLLKEGNILYGVHPEFEGIRWTDGRFEVGGLDYKIESAASYAIFDLNNDGTDGLVVKQTHTIRSRDYENIYAANVGEFDFSTTPVIDANLWLQRKTVGISPARPLSVKSESGKSTTSVWLASLFPFIHDDRAYVVIQTKNRVSGTNAGWSYQVLIVEYTGKIPIEATANGDDEFLKLVCLMRGEI